MLKSSPQGISKPLDIREFSAYLYQQHRAQSLLSYDHEVFSSSPSIHDTLQEIHEGLLQPREPGLYVYAQDYENELSFGLFAEISVLDYEQGLVKKHELCLPDREHAFDLGSDHVGAVTLTYPFSSSQLLDRLKSYVPRKPELAWKTKDSRSHRVWPVPAEDIRELLDRVRSLGSLYILDGHHRLEGYLRHYRSSQDPQAKYVLSLIVPPECVRVYPRYRLLRPHQNPSQAEIIDLFREIGVDLLEERPESSPNAEAIKVQLHERTFFLVYNKQNKPLEQRIGVAFIDGILLPRLRSRLAFELEMVADLGQRVAVSPGQILLASEGVSKEYLFEMADSSKVMPAKATWIQPKPALRAVVKYRNMKYSLWPRILSLSAETRSPRAGTQRSCPDINPRERLQKDSLPKQFRITLVRVPYLRPKFKKAEWGQEPPIIQIKRRHNLKKLQQ